MNFISSSKKIFTKVNIEIVCSFTQKKQQIIEKVRKVASQFALYMAVRSFYGVYV